ncbi:MAG: FGGY-family carbohydrate kinase [Gemmobacter sp.]|nr:FGGY-family carbohydrate kinase [Gemmobacter sp.]
MIRAICEGVAFQLPPPCRRDPAPCRRHLACSKPLTGGGRTFPALGAQVFADVCNRPVEVVAAEEVGALGAAICAAVAGGIYPDLTTAAAAVSRIGRTHLPNPGHVAF